MNKLTPRRRHAAIRNPHQYQPQPSGLRQKLDFYWRLPLWKKIFLVAGPLAIVLIVGGVITTVYFANTLTSKERIMNRNNTGVTLLDRGGAEFYSFNDAHAQTQVPLAAIAQPAQQAVIAAEDKDFYEHAGFSFVGIANAVRQNLLPSGSGGGGSTITQQLVKNSLLTQQRSFIRKYQEFVLAVEIERRYSKQEILEMYLNSAYFGEGAFGIEDAAQAYFSKPAKDLDAAQAAMLIGLLPAPSAYSPITGDSAKAERRQGYVLGRMQEDGYLTAAQADAADAQPLAYNPQPVEDKFKAPHFALLVREQLEQKYGEEKIARSGYKVKTTLDLGKQALAEEAVAAQVSRLSGSAVGNGAAVVMDPRTGEVLALVGSTDWNNNSFGKVNMATASRQPGSSFKPIVYAAGINDQTITAATILHDKLTTFGDYTPRNYNSTQFWGDVTVRRALANSLNVPAVEALNKIGIADTISFAKSLGITTLTESPGTYGLPLALGSGQAKLLEMTGVYATFANEGKHNEPQTILSIDDKYGKQIFESKVEDDQVMSAGTAYIMSQMLSDNNARAATFGNSLTVASGRPVAVKTGTTEDYRDAWTIGYTPSLAIGVWIGNNDNAPMSSVAGSSGAAPIWRSLMQQYLNSTPVEQFAQPRGVVASQVCQGQEAIAQNAGTNTFTEYFLSGTAFSRSCNAAKQEAPKVETPKVETPAPQPASPQTPSDSDDNGATDTPADDEDPDDQVIPPVPATPTPPTPPGSGTNPNPTPSPTPTPTPSPSTPPSIFNP